MTYTITGKELSKVLNIPAPLLQKMLSVTVEVQDDPFYRDSNLKALAQSDEEVRAGQIVVKTFDELDALANG